MILVNSKPSTEAQALDALAAYAVRNPLDPALVTGCPHGAPYTLGDLSYLLSFGLGLGGVVLDDECVELLARCGVERATVPQYVVTADAESGMWHGKPNLVGRVILSRWLAKQDTECAHFDTALINGEEAAIEVRWAA